MVTLNKQGKIPRHVGIIMDGNGRWATFRGHKRSFGHKAGAKRVVEVVKTMFKSGVECLSLYAFSTENFSRPKNLLRAGKNLGSYSFWERCRLSP